MKGTGRTRRPARRLLRGLGIVVAIAVLVVVAAAVIVQTTGVPDRVRDRLLAQLSEQLGREVTAGDVGLRLFPRLSVQIEDVSVEGLGERPLVAMESIDVRLALWPIVSTLGREIRVVSLGIVSPRLTLLRTERDEWDHEIVLREWESETEREVVLERLFVRDGEVLVEDRLAGGTAVSLVSGLRLDAGGVGPGLPLEVRIEADEPRLDADLTIDPLPTRVIGLPAERWPEVRGRIALADLSVEALRGLLPPGIAATISGGRVMLDGEIETRAPKTYALKGSMRLDDLLLRGEEAEGQLRLSASMPAGRLLDVRVDITEAQVQGPGIDLGMTAQLDGLDPARLQMDIEGELLSLDALVGPSGAAEAEERPADALIPGEWRARLQRAQAQARFDIRRVTRGRLELTDLRAAAGLVGGVFTLHEGEAGLYDGKVSLAGTRIDLGRELPTWEFAGRLTDVDIQRAFSEIAGAAPVAGRLSGRVDLSGEGADWEAVRENLTGRGTVSLSEGALTRLDLRGAVSSALEKAIAGQAPEPGPQRGRTEIRDLSASFAVRDGWMHFDRPLALATPFATGTLEGRVGLDQRLDLDGTLLVAPEVVAGATARQWTPDAPVPLPLDFSGTLMEPRVGVDARRALTGAVAPGLPETREQLRDRLREEAERRLRF